MRFDEQMSKDFSLSEFLRSANAKKLGILNTPTPAQVKNIRSLATFLLQPLRDLLERPVVIESGFRNEAVNALAGGKKDSQHQALYLCAAVDIRVPGMTARELYSFIVENQEKLNYDQCILEEDRGVVHLSFRRGRQMNFVLS